MNVPKIESVDVLLVGFLLFLFGMFFVAVGNIEQERDETAAADPVRCQMAFGMATSYHDSVIVGIANKTCRFPGDTAAYWMTFPDTGQNRNER